MSPLRLFLELELELIQTQMAQKPMLRAEVYANAMRASQNRKKGNAQREGGIVLSTLSKVETVHELNWNQTFVCCFYDSTVSTYNICREPSTNFVDRGAARPRRCSADLDDFRQP